MIKCHTYYKVVKSVKIEILRNTSPYLLFVFFALEGGWFYTPKIHAKDSVSMTSGPRKSWAGQNENDQPRIYFPFSAVSIKYHQVENDTASMAISRLKQAIQYYDKGMLNLALENLLEVTPYFENDEPSFQLHQALQYMGNIYEDLGKIERSEELQKKVLQISNELKRPDLILKSSVRLADIYLRQGLYTDCLKFFNQAVALATEINAKEDLILAYNGLAKVHYHMGSFDQSIYSSKMTLGLIDDSKSQDEAALVYNTLGLSYMGIHNYKLAEHYLLLSHSTLSKISRNALAWKQSHEALYRLYETIGNHKKALHHFKNFAKLNDSIYGGEINEKILQLEVDRSLNEKQMELNNLELQRMRQQMRYERKIKNIIAITSSLLVLLLFVILVFFTRNRHLKMKGELSLAKNKLESLRSQMNPHFIFNAINGIQNLILKADKYEAYEQLTKFSMIMRLILKNAPDTFINFEEEVDIIKTYVGLEKVRFRDKFEFNLQISEGLLEEKIKVPSMLIQPVVENAIIHGLSNKDGKGMLKIELKKEDKIVLCIVEDNGIGRKEAQNIKKENKGSHLSISSENSEQRVAILNKLGYFDASIMYHDVLDDLGESNGTKAIIQLPIQI